MWSVVEVDTKLEKAAEMAHSRLAQRSLGNEDNLREDQMSKAMDVSKEVCGRMHAGHSNQWSRATIRANAWTITARMHRQSAPVARAVKFTVIAGWSP